LFSIWPKAVRQGFRGTRLRRLSSSPRPRTICSRQSMPLHLGAAEPQRQVRLHLLASRSEVSQLSLRWRPLGCKAVNLRQQLSPLKPQSRSIGIDDLAALCAKRQRTSGFGGPGPVHQTLFDLSYLKASAARSCFPSCLADRPWDDGSGRRGAGAQMRC
jgi:hypothetical protein